jgi:transcriptional regulator with XRE-family HTH domain
MKKYPRFAERLRKLRGDITQKDYARDLGISLRAYQNYESGRRVPKPAIIDKIAQKGGVHVNWILMGSLKSLAEKVVATRVEASLLYESFTKAETELMHYFFKKGIVNREDIDVFMNMTAGLKHKKFEEIIDSLVGNRASPLYVMKAQLERIYNEGDSKKIKVLKSVLKALDPMEKPTIKVPLLFKKKD